MIDEVIIDIVKDILLKKYKLDSTNIDSLIKQYSIDYTLPPEEWADMLYFYETL